MINASKQFSAIVLTAALALPSAAFAEQTPTTKIGFKDNANVTRWARGTYEYLEGKSGRWRGEDEWTLTVNADGTRTMRMLTLVQETGVMRDIVHRVDENFRPVEMFTATYKDAVRTGTGLFVFDGDVGHALVNSPHGFLTQEIRVPEQFAMVPHSMASDGWYFPHYDREQGGVQQIPIVNPHGWGNTNGSILARIQSAPIEFVGEERITVPAGTFDTEKWTITNGGDRYWVWVYGEDHVMVKLIDEPRDWVYNLSSFETSQ